MLQASTFPYLTGFSDLGTPVSTNAAGGFTLTAPDLTQTTELRVRTLDAPPIYSQIVKVKIAVLVTLNARPAGKTGYVRLSGTVAPAEVGAPVEFQWIKSTQQAGDRGEHGGEAGHREHLALQRHGKDPPQRLLPRAGQGEQRQAGVGLQPHRHAARGAGRAQKAPRARSPSPDAPLHLRLTRRAGLRRAPQPITAPAPEANPSGAGGVSKNCQRPARRGTSLTA